MPIITASTHWETPGMWTLTQNKQCYRTLWNGIRKLQDRKDSLEKQIKVNKKRPRNKHQRIPKTIKLNLEEQYTLRAIKQTQ